VLLPGRSFARCFGGRRGAGWQAGGARDRVASQRRARAALSCRIP
jgi:hypothetical protein